MSRTQPTPEQRLAQLWKRITYAMHNLEMAEQRHLSENVLDHLIAAHAAAVAAYHAAEEEIGHHAFHP